MTQDNKKKVYLEYLNRWQLVNEMEDQEIRDASFDLLFKQTVAIWDMGKSLDFFNGKETSELIWPELQRKWINSHD